MPISIALVGWQIFTGGFLEIPNNGGELMPFHIFEFFYVLDYLYEKRKQMANRKWRGLVNTSVCPMFLCYATVLDLIEGGRLAKTQRAHWLFCVKVKDLCE